MANIAAAAISIATKRFIEPSFFPGSILRLDWSFRCTGGEVEPAARAMHSYSQGVPSEPAAKPGETAPCPTLGQRYPPRQRESSQGFEFKHLFSLTLCLPS